MGRSLVPRAGFLTFEMPLQTYFPAALLPFLNAFTVPTALLLPNFGLRELSIFATYVSAAPSGQVKLQISFRGAFTIFNSNETIVDPTVPLVVAQPFAQQSFFNLERRGPIPGAGATVRFVVRVPIPRGATSVLIAAAEAGVGASGTLTMDLTAGT
jgi:hypothetical protein